MRHVAILISVENYSDSRIESVDYATDDADALASVLTEHGFAASDQLRLIDVKATKAAIESKVRTVIAGLGKDDTLYLYYAGHGFGVSGKNYITCYDTDTDDPGRTSVAIDWLLNEIKSSRCKKAVLFLDSCESGQFASAGIRGLVSQMTEGELKAFFNNTEHCVCFAACRPDQSSHSAEALKHGIWTYHLIMAFDGRAPKALEKGHLLTAISLQDYLADEVPRTLRTHVSGTLAQTPWFYGALSSDFLIADVKHILDKQKIVATPHANQLRRVRLLGKRGVSIRKLSGFEKHHRVPNGVNTAAESFIARIAAKDVKAELDAVHESLRQEFDFKRRDLTPKESPSGGSIITPYFEYELTVSLDPDDLSSVIWHRQVVNIREPDKVLTREFESAFSGKFDTLEFTSDDSMDIPAIVDQIEALDNDVISVSYDTSQAWCEIKVVGVESTLRIEQDGTCTVQAFGKSAKALIDAFFELQKSLIDTYAIKALPF